MASRLLHRLKRSLFKDGEGVGPEPQPQPQPGGVTGGGWEAELEEEEECVAERLGGKLRFEEDAEDDGEGSGRDSDSDVLGETMEDGLGSADASPSRTPARDGLLFEVTDASIARDGASKYVLYTVHVIQAGGCDKTPAVITRRYSEFQRLHARLCRDHGDRMERVCFPRKKLRRNFTAETIARRSRAFEQYLSHLCSAAALRGALCVRQFFYLPDLQAAQASIREDRYQDALGPLLNAKRLQQKLGWARLHDNRPQAAPAAAASSHWFYTLVALVSCFQEVEQLEEAREHCGHALCFLSVGGDPPRAPSPHPLLLPLSQAMVRLSWRTGRDKRQWEELLRNLEEGAGLDNEPTIREFLLKHRLEEGGGAARDR